MSNTFFIYMFTLGLGTSLHCVSMCGPLVLTYALKGAEDGPWYSKITPNVAYQGAKLVSYMLVGLLLGAVGAYLNIDARAPVRDVPRRRVHDRARSGHDGTRSLGRSADAAPPESADERDRQAAPQGDS